MITRTALLCALLAGSLLAQEGTAPTEALYFSSRYAITPASERGQFVAGTVPSCGGMPGFGGMTVIESVVSNSEGINFVIPGVPNATRIGTTPPQTVTDFVEIANFPQYRMVMGDTDGNQVTNERDSFSGVDAMWAPTAASGRTNGMYEIFVSTWNDQRGAQGFAGANLTEADLFLVPRASNRYPAPPSPQAPIVFVDQADWEVFFSMAPGTGGSIDLNGFTVDPTTGDIYATFDRDIANATLVTDGLNPASVMVTTIARGDVVRIPAAAYTPSGPYGIVTSPLGGRAERVLPAAEVAQMVTNAGGTIQNRNPVNTYGLSLDPNGLVFLSSSNFVSPDLVFVVDNDAGRVANMNQNVSAGAVYSTQMGVNGLGTYAVINGLTMDGPAAAGIDEFSFDNSFYAGPLDAIDVQVHATGIDPIFGRGLHLDSFPAERTLSASTGGGTPFYNGTLTGYLSGLVPGSPVYVFCSVELPAPGGFAPRWDVRSLLPVTGDQTDLFVDPFGLANNACVLAPTAFAPFCQIPAFQSAFNAGVNPVVAWTDPLNGATNGDTCFDIDLSVAIPVGTAAFSRPPLIIFQAFDAGTLRLSDPLAFQLD